MRHFVPLDVKTEPRFTPRIFFFDLFFICGMAGFGFLSGNMVIPALRTVYLGFNVLVGVYLTRKSYRQNPKKRNFQTIWFYLRRPRTTFRPIEVELSQIKSDENSEVRKHYAKK